jgi:hypothetical protein
VPVLIGLHGRRGAGKDTAYAAIHEWAVGRGVRAARRGFADALKLSFARLFLPDCSLDEAVNWAETFKTEISRSKVVAEWTSGFNAVGETESTIRHKISGRQALQRYGTEAHRDVFGEDFWVDALLPTDVYQEGTVGPQTVGMEPRGRMIRRWPENFRQQMDFSPISDSSLPEICVITDVRFENEANRIHELGGKVWEVHRSSVETGDTHASEAPLPSDCVDLIVDNNGTIEKLNKRVAGIMSSEYRDLPRDHSLLS